MLQKMKDIFRDIQKKKVRKNINKSISNLRKKHNKIFNENKDKSKYILLDIPDILPTNNYNINLTKKEKILFDRSILNNRPDKYHIWNYNRQHDDHILEYLDLFKIQDSINICNTEITKITRKVFITDTGLILNIPDTIKLISKLSTQERKYYNSLKNKNSTTKDYRSRKSKLKKSEYNQINTKYLFHELHKSGSIVTNDSTIEYLPDSKLYKYTPKDAYQEEIEILDQTGIKTLILDSHESFSLYYNQNVR